MIKQFKIGEWVVEKNSGFVIRAYEDMIQSNFSLWFPKEGDICVFWQHPLGIANISYRYIVAPFSQKHELGKSRGLYRDVFGDRHMYCAPIEILKELKDRYSNGHKKEVF